MGIFLYKELATDILFGEKWSDASNIVGIWAITSGIRIVSASFYSDIYRAKGKPKLSMALQCMDIIAVLVVCIIGGHLGFWPLVFLRAISRCDLLIPNLVIGAKIVKSTIKKIVLNIIKPITCTIIMVIVWKLIRGNSENILWEVASILICVVVYLVAAIIIDKEFTLTNLKNFFAR